MNKILILLLMVIGCSSSASRTGVPNGSYEGKCYDNGSCDTGYVCEGSSNVCLTPSEVGSDTTTSVSSSSTGTDSTGTTVTTDTSTLSCSQQGEKAFADWLNANGGVDFGMDIVYGAAYGNEAIRYDNLVYPITDLTKNIWISKNQGMFKFDQTHYLWSVSFDAFDSDNASVLDYTSLLKYVSLTIKTNNCSCVSGQTKIVFNSLPADIYIDKVANPDFVGVFWTEWDLTKVPSNICVTLK